jgi:uncharacterized membrane protein YgdD (TMEM256/DUF423 family)
MADKYIRTGALFAALAVATGAFGAHTLKTRLEPSALELWETAARYLMYGGLALILLGLFERSGGAKIAKAGLALILGTIVFCGTVFALALGAPRFLGAVTPLGGLLLIFGFLFFALAAHRASSRI